MESIEDRKDQFWRDGYLILRDVFSRAEIEDLRGRAEKSADHQGDLLSNPLLRDVLLDGKAAAIAKVLLGTTPVYFGDSSANFGTSSFGYHRDNTDRKDPRGPDWQGKYPLIRFGLYLQDHSVHSGGLNLIPRSHDKFKRSTWRTKYCATRPGDLVMWNMRMTHSGNGILLKFPRRVHLPPRVAYRVPQFLRAPTERTRIGLFFSFGTGDRHMDRLLTCFKTRTYMIDSWKSSTYEPGLAEAAKRAGFTLRDVWNEFKHEPGLGLHAGHVDIPY